MLFARSFQPAKSTQFEVMWALFIFFIILKPFLWLTAEVDLELSEMDNETAFQYEHLERKFLLAITRKGF